MKYIFLLVASVLMHNVIALQSIDFDKTHYHCRAKELNGKINAEWIALNCTHVSSKTSREVVGGSGPSVIDTRIANNDALDVTNPKTAIIETFTFSVDEGNKVKCIFKDNKLQLCKTSVSKKIEASQPLNSAKASVSATK